MANVAVIGAGAMGLAAAYHALRAGHSVTVYEASPRVGGMAAHFDFGGLSIERYYHFVCKADQPTFDLMDELGIGDRMRWVPTSMGYFIDGKLHPWGDPISLLRFPGLSIASKVRYGATMFFATRRKDAGQLEHESARAWIERTCGRAVYDRLWRPLFELKFHELADPVSAAWIWTRIKRIGTSRRSIFQEELGYIDGGSETLVTALAAGIQARGGVLRLNAPVERVETANGHVTAIHSKGERTPHDAVISTVPTPLVASMIPDLPDASKDAYKAIANIGVVCLIFKLKRQVSQHFWVNIVDPRAPIPGLIEFSNLRATGHTIVYVPYYMPVTNPKWALPDADLIAEAYACLKLVNPALRDDDLIEATASRLKHAQPICPPGFGARIPPIQTAIAGLQVADTCFYYPEDRGISESVRYGRIMAAAIDGQGDK
ncbi:MAG: NAD(P)/FAD-dependent oxidoreductase [Hyphomicrobiaceae bacterium]